VASIAVSGSRRGRVCGVWYHRYAWRNARGAVTSICSGQFVLLAPSDHNLRLWDRLERGGAGYSHKELLLTKTSCGLMLTRPSTNTIRSFPGAR
jgi:hypothetical protein